MLTPNFRDNMFFFVLFCLVFFNLVNLILMISLQTKQTGQFLSIIIKGTRVTFPSKKNRIFYIPEHISRIAHFVMLFQMPLLISLVVN